jgi:hypothetical protein
VLADPRRVHPRHLLRDAGELVADLLVELGTAVAQNHGLLRSDERPRRAEVGELARAVAVEDRQVHVRRLARRRAVAVVVVGVPVGEPQRRLYPRLPQPGGDADQQRAVAAEHERELSAVDGSANGAGERRRRLDEGAEGDHAGASVALRRPQNRPDVAAIAHAESPYEPGLAEGGGSMLLAAPGAGGVERSTEEDRHRTVRPARSPCSRRAPGRCG